MRVAVISGSPRQGGNTSILAEEALKAVSGRVEVDLIHLADETNGDALPDASLLESLLQRLDQADAILLASPSYFGMPTAALKLLLDASWERARKRRWEGKVGAALTVENTSGGELTAQSLAQFFTAHHMLYLGYVVGRGLKEREILFDIKAIRDARDLATRVVDFLEERKD